MCAFIFENHELGAVSAVKLLKHLIANLNLKGLSYIYTVQLIQLRLSCQKHKR